MLIFVHCLKKRFPKQGIQSSGRYQIFLLRQKYTKDYEVIVYFLCYSHIRLKYNKYFSLLLPDAQYKLYSICTFGNYLLLTQCFARPLRHFIGLKIEMKEGEDKKQIGSPSTLLTNICVWCTHPIRWWPLGIIAHGQARRTPSSPSPSFNLSGRDWIGFSSCSLFLQSENTKLSWRKWKQVRAKSFPPSSMRQ